MVKLVYFAWVRERIGLSEETATLPGDVVSVRDLLTWLQARGEGYAQALRFPKPSASPSTRSMSTTASPSPAPARSRSSRP